MLIIIDGWYPNGELKKGETLYKLMDVFLTDHFFKTSKRNETTDLVVTQETKFVGNLLNMQEVVRVTNLKEPFCPFFVTKSEAKRINETKAGRIIG